MASGPKMECLVCGDIIQSTYRHDFKWCMCGAVAIDGGDAYTRVVGNHGDWKLLGSDYEESSAIAEVSGD